MLRAFSSVGRAPPLQGGCQEFKSLNAHHIKRVLILSFLMRLRDYVSAHVLKFYAQSA